MRTLAQAELSVHLGKIVENARTVVRALPGVDVVGVTKVTCGTPEVADAMLAGGVRAIGESRLENIERMRSAGIEADFWLVRASTPDLAEDAVRLADVSLESEITTVWALDEAAAKLRHRHGVVAMVDVGDLREGMLAEEVPRFVQACAGLRGEDGVGARLVGLGTSLTCYGSVVPSMSNVGELVRHTLEAEKRVGRSLLVSGGSSTSIELVASGVVPGVDNLRIGEAIVLGVDPATRERILGLHTDALVLAAPVIECKRKPSVPIGEMAQDAFGMRPVFEDRGERMRAICAIGRQDAPAEGLRPVDPRVRVLGASSDHLILDVEDLPEPPGIGEPIEFVPGYSATLGLFTSPYVRKVMRG